MDLLSISGLALALVAVLLSQGMDGGQLASLLNWPALIIVIGGTLGAVMVQSPRAVFKRALRRSVWLFLPPGPAVEETLNKLVRWSETARDEGLLGLENLADQEHDEFAARALLLLVEGSEPDELRRVLELDLSVSEEVDTQAARLFEGMGGYAPTIGILGAVLGLIQAMENLADPARLGAGIAAAFVATVYGVGFANLVCLPLANKLRNIIQQRVRLAELVIEGAVAIADGNPPRTVAARLTSFARHER